MKNFLLTGFISAFLTCACFVSSSRAHPHVFVDAQVTLLFDDDGLVGFREEWTLDEMFSELSIDGRSN